MNGEDDGHIVSDLIRLLENLEGDDLAAFLEAEHRELLRLRDQMHIHKTAVAELGRHLQHVFAAVGGLGALPLSAATRSILVQPGSPEPQALMTPVSPMSPLSPGSTSKTKARSAIPLVRGSPASATFRQQQAAARASACFGVCDAAAQTDDDGQVGDLAAGLQLIVSEQRADIEELELALQERRGQVRGLRKQLREKELQQLPATSDESEAGGRRRVPSAYVNGWPVYDSSAAPQACEPAAKAVGGSSDGESTDTQVHSPDTSAQPAEAPQPPRTPKASVADGIIGKTPRRIYSRLSSRLKKI